MADPRCLDTLPLFATLSAETRRRLAAGAVERQFRTGATLFRAGSEPPGLFILLSGRIRVVRASDGRQHVIHNEGPGGTLAEIPFFAGGALPATALATEPSRCLILSRDVLYATMREDPALALLLLKRLSLRVRDLVERLDSVSSRAVPARLAGFLLARGVPAQPFNLGMTQAALAEELGTVREVVVRALGRLRQAGIIKSAGRRGRYVIKDLAALRALAGS